MHVDSSSNGNSSATAISNNCAKSDRYPCVHMPIVPIIINDIFHTYALLDTGSSTSFCSRRLAEELKITGYNVAYQLRTIHGSKDCNTEAVKFKMTSEDGKEVLKLNDVLVVEEIPIENFSADVSKFQHLSDLSFSSSKHVDVLIGQDNASALAPIDVRRGPVGTPFAIRTIMGWCLNGMSTPRASGRRAVSNFISMATLDEKINKLWKFDDEGMEEQQSELSTEDHKVLNLWDKECKVVNNHFELPIPWKSPDEPMPNNLNVATHRLKSLITSVRRKSLFEAYDKQVDQLNICSTLTF